MQSNDRNLTYKQRYGYEELPAPMRIGELSADIRREISDSIWEFLKEDKHYSRIRAYFLPVGERFVRHVLGEALRRPKREINCDMPGNVANNFEKRLTQESCADTLHFIEIIVNAPDCSEQLSTQLADLFEKHRAPYILDLEEKPYRIFQRTSKEESDATAASIQAIKNAGGFEGALTHLRDASRHISNGQFPDAIHDSISAVESVARVIAPNTKTLGPAFTKLEESGIIKHPALKEAFSKLYGYTSDEQGIRHALLDKDEADVGLAEALYFYNACAAFAGYLATVGKVR